MLRGTARQVPEEIVEQMARYAFSLEPTAVLEETAGGTVLPADENADWAPAIVADKDSEVLNTKEDDDGRVEKQLQDFLQGGLQYGIHINTSSGTSYDAFQGSDS